ncbi:barwin-like endoglucanase [Boletus edulis]|nr:barwin-like endoglucanase [Boletus edulis]
MFSSLIVVLSAILSFFVVTRAVPLDLVVDSVAGGSDGPFTSGIATWYTQDNNAGACGAYHTDNDLIGAMSSARYTDSLCGRQVQITNTDNGNTVTVTIADDCPSCENENSIDLSIAAFQQLNSDLGAGVLPSQFPFLASFPVPFFADVLKQVSWVYIS